MKLLIKATVLLILFHAVAQGNTRSWSEGACKPKEYLYEGATRDFYNRGAGQKWENNVGDWFDGDLTPQGTKPFVTTTIQVKKKYDTIGIDVTSIVKLWQDKEIENQGFRLVSASKSPLSLFSKDQPEKLYHPILTLFTDDAIHTVFPSADTVLNKSTYRCLGNEALLKARYPLLINFNLSTKTSLIRKAILTLTVAKNTKKKNNLSVFATRITGSNPLIKQSISSNSFPDNTPNALDNIYSTSFQEEDWSAPWKGTFRGNFETISQNAKEKFVKHIGNALEVTIKKGDHLGISAKYPLPKDLKQVYFRYYLRFGDSWIVNTSGKLPGFSGTYQNQSFKAGWGGRKSNGSNGWSARMFVEPTLSSENIHANKTPVGTYLYHSHMQSTYGDLEYWNLHDTSLLKKNVWYSIEQFIKYNSPNKKDGKLTSWINGKLVYNKEGISFSNHPLVGIENVWLNVYHGGKNSAPKDLTVFIDDLVISKDYIGPNKK